MQTISIFSTAYFPLVGGAEVAMKEVTDRLPAYDFHLYCAQIKPGLVRTERIGNVTVHRIGFGVPFDKYLLPFFGALQAAWRVRLEEKPLIWSLMASQGGFAALVFTWLRPKARFLLTLQEGDPLEHYAARLRFLPGFQQKIFQRANAVQAISRFLGTWAEKMGFKGQPQIVPNGVDLERFSQRISLAERLALRKKLGYEPSDRVIITASRLVLKNGTDDLIRALTFLPAEYKVLIAGEGSDREKLESLVKQKELGDRVQFLGTCTHEALPALLQASDVFCRPSLSEGLGNSFLEAMASGLPTIGTPVGGIPDFLEDGITGYLCLPRQPETIAAAVERIFASPEEKERVLLAAQERVHSGYEWTGIAQQIQTILAQL